MPDLSDEETPQLPDLSVSDQDAPLLPSEIRTYTTYPIGFDPGDAGDDTFAGKQTCHSACCK